MSFKLSPKRISFKFRNNMNGIQSFAFLKYKKKLHSLFIQSVAYRPLSIKYIWSGICNAKMSHNVPKRTFGRVLPVKIQISMRIHAVGSESSLVAFRIAKDAKCLYAENDE